MYANNPIPQALPAATCTMQALHTTTTTRRAAVNLAELAEVDTIHLPAGVIRFAPLEELHREGQHIKARRPELAEEVDFRLACEKQRRSFSHMQLA